MSIPLLVFLVIFVVVFLIRMPIGLGMIVAAAFYFYLTPAIPSLSPRLIAQLFVNNMLGRYILIAVPLFVFMAEIMNSGKVTDIIFRFANVLVGKKHGALGHVNVIASIIFSGMTGSAMADASGLGSMEIKAMNDHGYDPGFSCAITASSAVIGPIFPPSIPMILYSMLSGASIGALFIGGMVPGILIGIALMIYISIVAKRRDYPLGDAVTAREVLVVSLKAFPALFTIVILLGGIYGGWVTPTEAGALASFYALLISYFVYRAMSVSRLIEVLKRTVLTSASLSIIIGAAFAFSYIVAIEGIPQAIAEFLLGVTDNRFVLLLIINVVFLILGMFIDTMSIILIFIPIVLPMVSLLGINLVHFGVVITMNMMIGLATPPFGLLLFVVSNISKTPLRVVIREIAPMLLILIGVLMLITFVEPLVMFLPRLSGFS